MRWPTAGGGGVLTSPSGKTGYMKHNLNLTMTMPLHTATQTEAFSGARKLHCQAVAPALTETSLRWHICRILANSCARLN